MPSTLVHLALAGLIAAALLGEAFDRRALLAVFVATAVPDLDSFVALVSTVGHRAAFHTFVIPIVAACLLLVDLRLRRSEAVRSRWPAIDTESLVRRRWGARGVRIAWVAILCYAVAGIALDATAGVLNPFWPIHDQYYAVSGSIELSSQRGLVQTFVDVGASGGDGGTTAVGSTADVELSTGVNPDHSGEGPVDHVVPIARSDWQLYLLLVGTAITVARFAVDQRLPDAE